MTTTEDKRWAPEFTTASRALRTLVAEAGWSVRRKLTQAGPFDFYALGRLIRANRTLVAGPEPQRRHSGRYGKGHESRPSIHTRL